METLLCTECKGVNWLEYGCINNKQKGAEICLECCGCPEHEPNSHEEDVEAFGECRKCAQGSPNYGYSDCPNFCEYCEAYDEDTHTCKCEVHRCCKHEYESSCKCCLNECEGAKND